MQPTDYRGSEMTVHGVTRSEIEALADNWEARAAQHGRRGDYHAERITRGVAEMLHAEAAECAPRPDPGFGRFAVAAFLSLVVWAVLWFAAVGLFDTFGPAS